MRSITKTAALMCLAPMLLSAQTDTFGRPVASKTMLTTGAHVKVSLGSRQVRDGELLAVSADSLWLKIGFNVEAHSMRDVTRVAIDRNKGGAGAGFKRMAIFGLISGAGMTAACAQVSDGCAVMIPVSVLASTFVAVIAMPSMDAIKYKSYARPSADTLRAWARFPQGLPVGVPRDSLVSRRDPP